MKSLNHYLLEAVTEYDERHLVAQRNAAMPIEHGGLGLSSNNTAVDRANAMGYTTKAYHGTSHDFTKFSSHHIGKHFDDEEGFFFTPETSYVTHNGNYKYDLGAGSYAKNSADKSDTPPHILPVLLKMNKPKTIEGDSDGGDVLDLVETRSHGAGHYFKHEIVHNGYDSMIVRDIGTTNRNNGQKDGVYINNTKHPEIYAVKEPHQIRSIHAAFDPMKKHSDDILA